MEVDPAEQLLKVLARELPFEGLGDGAIVVLEAQQPLLQLGQGSEVVRSEGFALDDREIHFDLVEPAGMYRCVHRDDGGPASLQAPDAGLSAVRGAIVHDPEHSRSGSIGLLFHHLRDQTLERANPCLSFTAPEDPGPTHIPSGKIGPRSAALIFVLDAHGAVDRGGQGGVNAPASLNARLLIGGQNAIGLAQGFALPLRLIQVQYSAGFELESRITRENPGAMSPGSNGIVAEPAPQGRFTDRGHQPALDDFAADLRHAPARQRHLRLVGQLAGQGLNGYDEAGGKRAPGARCGIVPPNPAVVLGRSACATC